MSRTLVTENGARHDKTFKRDDGPVQIPIQPMMPKKHRIVIAEDHTIVREGLRSLLTSDPEFEISGEAEDGREAIQRVETLAPDLVLMDLSMPRMNGMEAIREIKKRTSETKIIVLTVHKNDEYNPRGLSSRCKWIRLEGCHPF